MAKNPHYFSQMAHIEVLTKDLAKSVEFFRDVVGMDETGREENSVYLRAWGDYFHHTLKLTQSKESGLGHIGWRADSPEALLVSDGMRVILVMAKHIVLNLLTDICMRYSGRSNGYGKKESGEVFMRIVMQVTD